MQWSRYIAAAIVCLNVTAASAELTLGPTRGTPRIVSIPPGPTAQAAGSRLRAAVAAIGDASSTRPYVVKVDPGDYDLGDDSLVMKSWVSIRGSDRASTRISGDNINYLVRTASDTDIAGLSLENRGGKNRARTLFSYDVARVTIRDVAVKASNGSALTVGIWNEKASPAIRDVTVHCTGAGGGNVDGIVNQDGASPSIWRTEVVVEVPSGGLGSGIKGQTDCSPDMYDVTVQLTAAGSGRGQGLYFFGNCLPRVQRARVTVSGGEDIVGVFASSDSFPALEDIVVLVDGKGTAGEAYGIKCAASSSFDLERGRISVQGAEIMKAVDSGSGSSGLVMSIRRSRVVSAGTAINAAVGLTVRVASTVMHGLVNNPTGEQVNCVNCVDQNYAPLGADCRPAP